MENRKLYKYWILYSRQRNSISGNPMNSYTEALNRYDGLPDKSDWRIEERTEYKKVEPQKVISDYAKF